MTDNEDSNDLDCVHIQCPHKCPTDSYLKSLVDEDDDADDEDLDDYELDTATHETFIEELGLFEQPPHTTHMENHNPFRRLHKRDVVAQQHEIERCCGGQHCVCSKCENVPQCPDNYVAIEIHKGDAVPGNCCSTYKCVEKVKCSFGVKQTYWKDTCVKCSCFGEGELCENHCPENDMQQHCYSEYWEKPMLSGESWKEGSCTSCTCEQGERRCVIPLDAPGCGADAGHKEEETITEAITITQELENELSANDNSKTSESTTSSGILVETISQRSSSESSTSSSVMIEISSSFESTISTAKPLMESSTSSLAIEGISNILNLTSAETTTSSVTPPASTSVNETSESSDFTKSLDETSAVQSISSSKPIAKTTTSLADTTTNETSSSDVSLAVTTESFLTNSSLNFSSSSTDKTTANDPSILNKEDIEEDSKTFNGMEHNATTETSTASESSIVVVKSAGDSFTTTASVEVKKPTTVETEANSSTTVAIEDKTSTTISETLETNYSVSNDKIDSLLLGEKVSATPKTTVSMENSSNLDSSQVQTSTSVASAVSATSTASITSTSTEDPFTNGFALNTDLSQTITMKENVSTVFSKEMNTDNTIFGSTITTSMKDESSVSANTASPFAVVTETIDLANSSTTYSKISTNVPKTTTITTAIDINSSTTSAPTQPNFSSESTTFTNASSKSTTSYTHIFTNDDIALSTTLPPSIGSQSTTLAPSLALEPLFQQNLAPYAKTGFNDHSSNTPEQVRTLFDEIDYVIMIVLLIGALLCIALGLIIRYTKNRKKMYSSIPNSETSLSQTSTHTMMTV